MNSVNFIPMIVSLGVCVVLPIVIVALSLKHKLESEKNRKDIILAALEKNSNINVEELVRKMNKPDKLIKEKLLRKFQWGILTSIIGVGFLILSLTGCSVTSISATSSCRDGERLRCPNWDWKVSLPVTSGLTTRNMMS